MRRRVLTFCVVVWSLAAASGVAQAQTNDDTKLGLDASYDFLFKSDPTSASVHMGVWYLVQNKPGSSITVLGELGFTHFNFGTVTSIGVGPRMAFKLKSNPRIVPFGQVLVGFEHCCGENDFEIQPGGGIFYVYSPRLNIIAQIDFRHVTFDGGSENHSRYSAGISIPLGGE